MFHHRHFSTFNVTTGLVKEREKERQRKLLPFEYPYKNRNKAYNLCPTHSIITHLSFGIFMSLVLSADHFDLE